MRRDERSNGRTVPVFESTEDQRRSVEAGEIRFEHAAFVLLGVVLTVAVFLRGIGLL